MDQILRAFSATVDDVDNSDRSIVSKISVGSVDRYNSLILPKGIDLRAYTKNPVVLFEHGKDPARGTVPIGRNVWVKLNNQGNTLIAKSRFAKDDFSSLLYEFYRDGTMTGWSVRLLPQERGSTPTREESRSYPGMDKCEIVYRSTELAEYSATSVPGNSDCLSEPELRSLFSESQLESLSTLVVRGFWTPPDDVTPLLTPAVERMTESEGMASGGALVDDDGDDDDGSDDDDEDGVAKKKKKKKKRSVEDDDADDDGKPEPGDDAAEVGRSLDADDDDSIDVIERAGFDPSEPRDDTGEWTSGGADSEKNDHPRRKKKKLDIQFGEPDDNGTSHEEDTPASRKRDKATAKLQAKYDANPLYKSKELHDPDTGRTYHYAITKNAYYLASSEEKKYVVSLNYAKDGKHEVDDKDTFNSLDKAVKSVHKSYKLNIKEGMKPAGADRSSPDDDAVTRDAAEADEIATEAVVRSTPEPEVVAEPAAEPEIVVEPTPEPVDPLAGLPPLVGRSLEDVSRRNAAKINAWAESIRVMLDEFEGWTRGEA